jgi:WD40 repeat protein
MSRIALLGLCLVACLLIATAVGRLWDNPPPHEPQAHRNHAEGLVLRVSSVARLGTLQGVDDKTIAFLALSSDGKKVATLPQVLNPTLRIREVPSGKILDEIPLKIKYWESVALAPDFQKLAWAYLDNSVTVVDLATRKETVLNAPTNDARGVAVSFSSDGKKVFVTFSHHYSGLSPTRKGGDKQWVSMLDFEIIEWTLKDGTKRHLWKDDKTDNYKYRNFAFSPDGKALAYIQKKSTVDVADFEQEFVLEDAVTRKVRLKVPLKDAADYLMEFSPDGKVLALADEDSLRMIDPGQATVRWTASYKDEIKPPDERSSSSRTPWPEKIVWPHGGEVGVFFQPGKLWTWKTSDGKPATRYSCQATKPLAFARDAPVLAFTQDKRCLQFFDTSKRKVLQPVEGHRNPPQVLFRSDGSLVSHDDYKICLWTAGKWRFRTSFEFHEEGQRFYVGPTQDFFVRTVGTKIEVRSLESGKVIKEWTLKSAPDFVMLLPDGKTLAAGNLYHNEEARYKGAERLRLRLLDIPSGRQKEIPLPYQPWVVKLSGTKVQLALMNRVRFRDRVDLLDPASGKLRPLIDDKTVNVSLLDFSPDGRRLYFRSMPADTPRFAAKDTLASVELCSGKRLKYSLADEIQVAAFSADGQLLVYSPVEHVDLVYEKCAQHFTTPSNKIVVWGIASESMQARFETTNAWVKSVSCSPDNRYLATGLYDSTILIWDVQRPAKDK